MKIQTLDKTGLGLIPVLGPDLAKGWFSILGLGPVWRSIANWRLVLLKHQILIPENWNRRFSHAQAKNQTTLIVTKVEVEGSTG